MVETDADREALRLGKELVASPEWQAVGKFDGRLKQWLKTRSLPSFFRGGFYRLHIGLVEEVDRQLREEWFPQREELIEEAVGSYRKHVEEARHRLYSLYDPKDYLPDEAYRRAFYHQIGYHEFATPQRLESVSAEIFQRELARNRDEAQRIASLMQDTLRAEVAELIDHAAGRLEVTPGEEPKQFHKSMLEKIEKFLAYFDYREQTGDLVVRGLVEKLRAAVKGIPDARELRSDSDLRLRVGEQFAQLKAEMDASIERKPKRRIVFEEVSDGHE